MKEIKLNWIIALVILLIGIVANYYVYNKKFTIEQVYTPVQRVMLKQRLNYILAQGCSTINKNINLNSEGNFLSLYLNNLNLKGTRTQVISTNNLNLYMMNFENKIKAIYFKGYLLEFVKEKQCFGLIL